MTLSFLTRVSDNAAFTSGLRLGAPIFMQFSGRKYFSRSSFFMSFDKPVVAICSQRTASSACIGGPNFLFFDGFSPNISSMLSSKGMAGSGSVEVDGRLEVIESVPFSIICKVESWFVDVSSVFMTKSMFSSTLITLPSSDSSSWLSKKKNQQ